MGYKAKADGKAVPALAWLEANVPEGMVCPCCHRTMNWLRKDGGSTCITLQHDRDGTMRLICFGCNSRHSHMPGDSFYQLPSGTKKCHYCGEIKPDAEFYASTLCVVCRPLRMKAWRDANPEKVKAQRVANPEKTKAVAAAWRAANPEKVKAQTARRNAARKAKYAIWRAANPEEAKILEALKRAASTAASKAARMARRKTTITTT